MDALQLALVIVTFLLAVGTFWMAYVSQEHARLARAQYLADRAPLIEPRVKRCARHGDLLSATLAIRNIGAGALVIHRVNVRPQNDRRAGLSREHPYRMVPAIVYPRHEVDFHLELPVTDEDLAGGEQGLLHVGVWTLHVDLSVRGFPESVETWSVFALIRYKGREFLGPVNTTSARRR